MSIIDTIIKKRKEKQYQESLNKYGYGIGDISYNGTTQKKSRAFLCLVRGILIFMAAFGTTGSMVSAFGLNFYVVPVALITLAISMYIAFLYYNRITFYVGYAVLFFSFTISIISSYWYVNSGYQAYMNEVNKAYGDYFLLPSVREATEFVTDRTLTISFTMVFVAAFLAILLNITISSYMSLFWTFMITFPLTQFGFYIEKRPSLIYLIFLLGAYITVALLGRSGHYRLPDFRKIQDEFITTDNKKKNIQYHSYIADGTGMMSTVIYSVTLCTVFLLLTLVLFYTNLDSQHTTNKLKNTTDEYVKGFVQNGIWSILDSYNSKGGLSSGRLGGVGSVRPDYQTDLIATFVPVNTDPVYLRAFVGTDYTGNSFTTDIDSYVDNEFDNTTIMYRGDSYSLQEHIPLYNGSATMKVINVDADPLFDYMPYYSYELTSRETTPEGLEYEVEYIPAGVYEETEDTSVYEREINPVGNLSASFGTNNDYEEYVYNTYLDVPEDLSDYLANYLYHSDSEYFSEMKETSKAFNDTDDPTMRRELALQMAEHIEDHFLMEFYYTMAPGTTPRGEDFVEYFLEDQRRGYCAHFAASSTMLLRELGIPARYVEGYVISLSNIIDGTPLEENTNLYISSDTDVDIDTGVMQVEITDGSAHAWTEIYLDGYGWVIYDFTPPSTEETITNFSFASMISGLLYTGINNPGDINFDEIVNGGGNSGSTSFRFSLNTSFGFIIYPMAIVIAFTFLLIFIYKNINDWRISSALKKAVNDEDYNEAIRLRYIQLVNVTIKRRKIKKDISVTEFINHLTLYSISEDSLERLSRIINHTLYGNNAATNEDYEEVDRIINEIVTVIRKTK